MHSSKCVGLQAAVLCCYDVCGAAEALDDVFIGHDTPDFAGAFCVGSTVGVVHPDACEKQSQLIVFAVCW
jgi:hypothetical protein